MSELDNSQPHNRAKQIIYWNLATLNNLNSLSETIIHHQFPQLHTDRDRDWRNLFYFKKIYKRGQQQEESFLAKSAKYVFSNSTAINKLQLFKSYYYDQSIIKHQFWTRLSNLSPITKEDYECKRIVSKIVWKQRLFPYATAITLSIIFNKLSGIAKLKFSSQVVTSVLLLVISELVVKVKKSDRIFYQLPVLPNPQLEKERIKILQQSIIIDGKINSYDIASKLDDKVLNLALKQNQIEKNQILEAMGYKVITKKQLL